MTYASFMKDMAALLRRKKEDAGRRQSLFEGVSPGNVGNVFEISPSPLEFANTYSSNAYGVPVRILEMVGEDVLGEMICVSIQHERVLDDAEQTVGAGADTVEGPMIGIVEFGAGAGLSAFEFDLATPVVTPGFISMEGVASPDDANSQWSARLFPFRRLNGVMLSLPASSMRVFVRNDANAPYLIQGGGIAPTFSALPAVSINPIKKAAKIRVHATYGRRPYPHTLYRTIPICFSQTFDGSNGPTAPFTPNFAGNRMSLMIPAYAKRVFFPRFPLNQTALSVNFFTSYSRSTAGLSFRGNYTIPAGSDGPLDIYPGDSFIQINNPGPQTIENFSLVFELGI